MNKKTIYLDYAAAAPMDTRVKREILKYMDVFGNASSLHAEGRKAKEVIEEARARVGKIINCRPSELVFTGSGTEANNLAISQQFTHIVSTTIEHHSILRPLEKYKNVTYVTVNQNGIVDPSDVAKAIRPDTQLVSIIYANNEIGTIQPVKEIVRALKLYSYKAVKPLFHIDACQAAGYLDINVQNLGVDLMTINSSKIYGPKGIGALFVRRGVRLEPQILGGDQERGLRAGTQNPALIAGFAKALEIADGMREKESARLIKLRDWFIVEATSKIPGTKLNGDAVKRLPNNINLSFDGIDGEMLMLRLDLKGFAVSTGAACTVSSNEPSHVLQALSQAKNEGNLRISLGRSTTKGDLSKFLVALSSEISHMRNVYRKSL